MAASTHKLTGSWEQQVTEIANLIDRRITARYGSATAKQYVDEWLAYSKRNRGKGTVAQLYIAWFLTQSNLPQNLANDIITGSKTAAGFAGETRYVGKASVQGIDNVAHSLNPTQLWTNIWGVLSNSNTWIRIGEGVVALILLDVGLKAFTNKSVIETVAKKTPTGKLGKVL